MTGPDPNSIYPNENIRQVVYIKNVITRPNIEVGDYTYYDDVNGANHRMNSVTTYPFNIMGGGWERFAPSLEELPLKGDTIVGNDVWIGQNVTVMPGVHIGDGAIIAANSVVTRDIPAYCVAGGNPCRVIRRRFDEDLTEYLLKLRWWDWDAEKIFRSMDALCSGDLEKIKHIRD